MVWVRATRNTPAVTMVAAWIRADTGVGPAMASGSQTYSGNWALLPVQARNSSRAMAVTVPAASAPASPKTTSKSRLPVVAKIRNMASRKPTSPMRLARKAFLAAGGAHTSWVSSGSPVDQAAARVDDQQPPVEPEPDQQVRAEPDPLPAEEHDQEVLGQHQHQHRGHEQVEPGEEGLAPLVVLHVADRVQVDEAGDAGHDQGHGGRQGVPAQVEGDPQVAGGEPLVAAQDLGAFLAGKRQQLEQGGHGDGEGGGDGQGGDPAGQGAQALAEQDVDREPGQGQDREQPDQSGRAGSVQDRVTP